MPAISVYWDVLFAPILERHVLANISFGVLSPRDLELERIVVKLLDKHFSSTFAEIGLPNFLFELYIEGLSVIIFLDPLLVFRPSGNGYVMFILYVIIDDGLVYRGLLVL